MRTDDRLAVYDAEVFHDARDVVVGSNGSEEEVVFLLLREPTQVGLQEGGRGRTAPGTCARVPARTGPFSRIVAGRFCPPNLTLVPVGVV